MLACWRLGAVAQPCSEQLRPADLRARMEAVEPARGGGGRARPRPRGRERLRRAGAGRPRRAPARRTSPSRPRELRGRPPGADRLHLGHRRRAEADPPRRTATCAARACRPSTGTARGRATCAGAPPRAAGRCRRATPSWPPGCAARRRCCTTPASTPRSGWSCSSGERVNVLCMSPTEYRAIAKRGALRPLAGAAPRRGRRRAAQPGGGARVAGGRRACRCTTATARRRPAT